MLVFIGVWVRVLYVFMCVGSCVGVYWFVIACVGFYCCVSACVLDYIGV